ncbi:aldo-keto reductase [Aspergillus fijiensis CBS 313.89]|uniref:Aldo-keto reductase n=1 Tax=Aspergillus fijiensis CBS 313.89 TaxID=1448319 RepID=A0A8G1W375_9EURO|nr:aldo-keto reductase [Aspergillus fijiensis CBS 313.89]RAK82172.1 aldo-keto reductase [Aspergillus fijiensis CBS 313.89]
MLPAIQLGANGPLVSAQGLGLMGLSMFYGVPMPDEERLRFLDEAHAQGVTFWDTADVYADNEDILARWFQRSGRRQDIFLATKFGIQQRPGLPSSIHNEPGYVREACLRSRARLGLADGDAIDLYYCHRIDPEQPIEVTMRAMKQLVDDGLVKYLGLSECSAATLRRAHRVHPVAAVQVEVSPFAVDAFHNGLLHACEELGVAVVPYSPFSRGFLTGKIRSPDDFDATDRRRILPRFSAENFPKNLALVDRLQALAARKKCTVGQLSLAWLGASVKMVVPIPGTTRIRNLEENVGSLDVQLSPKDLEEINAVIQAAEVQGDRHPSSMMPYLYVDTVALSE